MFTRVQAYLEFETQAKQDNFTTNVNNFVKGKKFTHRDEGEPKGFTNNDWTIDYGFEEKNEAEEVFSHIKKLINDIPVLNGKVQLHSCKDDEPDNNEPCNIESFYSKGL